MPTKYRKAGQSQQTGLELEGRSICEIIVKPTSFQKKFLEVWRELQSEKFCQSMLAPDLICIPQLGVPLLNEELFLQTG